MNDKVQQSLNIADLDAQFKESDMVRDSVLRGGRSGGNSEFFMIMRDTVAQVSG